MKSCFAMSTLVEERYQGFSLVGAFLQREPGTLLNSVLGGSLGTLMCGLQLCPQGYGGQRECSEAKLCWMVLE